MPYLRSAPARADAEVGEVLAEPVRLTKPMSSRSDRRPRAASTARAGGCRSTRSTPARQLSVADAGRLRLGEEAVDAERATEVDNACPGQRDSATRLAKTGTLASAAGLQVTRLSVVADNLRNARLGPAELATDADDCAQSVPRHSQPDKSDPARKSLFIRT